MKIKLNVDLGGFKKDAILKGDILNSHYWRNRIKDSRYDNCLIVIKDNVAHEKIEKPIEILTKNKKKHKKYK